METKLIRQLFQKLIDETITAGELHQFYTYVKKAKGDTDIQQLLCELWGQIELNDYAPSIEPDNAGFLQLQKRMRFLDILVREHTQPDEIDEIIEKIVKGHYR